MKKIVKIVILSFMIFAMISVSVCAIYTSGDANTTRYYSPVRFDLEVFGTTAELTPTISYNSTSGVEVNSIETSTSPNNVLNSIRRINYSIGTTQSTVVDCTYRLWFDLNESVDTFTMKITASNGLFNFTKYGIPQLAVPTGYSVTANFNYHYHFTQDQSWIDQKGYTYSKSYEYTQGDDIDLLHNRIQIDNVSYAVLGDILIDDYICTLSFTKDGSQEGDAPYYLWNSVISLNNVEYFYETLNAIYDYDSFSSIYCNRPVTISCLYEGVVNTFTVEEIYFVEIDGWGDSSLELISGDVGFTAYSFTNDEWYVYDGTDSSGYYISADNMRLWYLEDSFDNTFSNTDDIFPNDPTMDQLYSNFVTGFKLWFIANTTNYVDNPLQTVQTSEGASTYAFTDGDGGMYLHYYLDRSLAAQSNNALNNLYIYGQSNGNGSNPLFNGEFSTWIGNTLVGVFGIQILPGFSLGGILGILLAILLGMLFLKKFAGG